jgi:hypothetical protein
MGIEPTTYSLGSCRSTTELRPRSLFSTTYEGPRCALCGHWAFYHGLLLLSATNILRILTHPRLTSVPMSIL